MKITLGLDLDTFRYSLVAAAYSGVSKENV